MMKNKIFEAYLKIFIKIFELLGLAQWVREIDSENIHGHELILWQEALKRSLKIENLKIKNLHSRFFRIKIGRRCFVFESLPFLKSYNKTNPEAVSNKWWVKKILLANLIPTPLGQKVKNFQEAKRFVKLHGYPVVVKPLCESQCLGVTVNIKNQNELVRAIGLVKKYGRHFLVETFVSGKCYRLTVAGKNMAAACLRRPPQVIGDGQSSIRKLITIKNHHPRIEKRLSSTLKPIIIDQTLVRHLESQNLKLKAIPQRGKRVILSPKVNLGSGAETIDMTGKVHPETEKICLKITQILDAEILGFDVLAKDISLASGKNNPVNIIEVNPFPFIDMHHYPFRGKSRNVAGAIWDLFLKEANNFRGS